MEIPETTDCHEKYFLCVLWVLCGYIFVFTKSSKREKGEKMRKKIALLTALLGLVSAGNVGASGYRVPEQSVNAVALSNAYIAHTSGPDTAYYNPANMGWQEDRWQVEANLSYINLPHINYSDAVDAGRDGSSKTENLFIPSLHLVSPDQNNFRFGFSLVVPYGLSKRWTDPFPANAAKEFTLNVFEGNPSVSYTFCDRFAIAAGARILHTTNNTVENGGTRLTALGPTTLTSEMDGDSTDLGYNLAMTVKALPNWSLAATYRSRVVQNLSGDAKLSATMPAVGAADTYRGDVALDVVTPAVLTLSTAYTVGQTTVELTWDRTYWSKYDHLDFDFDAPLSSNFFANLVLTAAYEAPKDKDWGNADAYRIGITHQCSERLTAMVGFAYDETPVPDTTLGFELPDADALLYSLGVRYQLSEVMEIGGAYLYDYKKTRKITAADANVNAIAGTFEDGGAHLLTMGLTYKF